MIGFIALTRIASCNRILENSHMINRAIQYGMPFGPGLVIRHPGANDKRLVVLVGEKKAVANSVRNLSGLRRWSKLNEWLAAPGANQKNAE